MRNVMVDARTRIKAGNGSGDNGDAMGLEIFTIVLDGMPWITKHLATFQKLKCEWRWTIIHGVADNVNDTQWIAKQKPRLSADGTTEYLADLSKDPRVRVLEKPIWPGKTAMCNEAIADAPTPCVILQVDADEIWDAWRLQKIWAIFNERPDVMAMQFWCRYFVGPNIVVGPRSGGNFGCRYNEWMRAWRMDLPFQRFLRHEPPIFITKEGHTLSRDATLSMGLEFDHYAYATRAQVEYKERVYKYPGAVAGWERLQANKAWPTRLKPFMTWVDEKSTANVIA